MTKAELIVAAALLGASCSTALPLEAPVPQLAVSAPPLTAQDIVCVRCVESGTSDCNAQCMGEAAAPSLAPSSLRSSSPDEIPIERRGGEYVVPVRVNQTITLPFVLDTGATELTIPVDVALTLMRSGALTRSDFIGKATVTMANGSEAIQPRVVIHEVQVGNHVATDVTASLSPVAAEPLLGESFLSKFGTVTINYNRLVLILSH